jgi:acyl-CoA dehydrogenase
MIMNNLNEIDDFRAATRAWLETNCPAEMRSPMKSDGDICWGGRNWKYSSDAQRLWLQRMAHRGWTVPTWPKEYGGGGLSRLEANVLAQEMAYLGCRPPLTNFGISMLGPTLFKFGTSEQKSEHLPKIARGEIRWCQGYSEPNSGSDLASLTTFAQDYGDHFIVNGQKIWTSYADQSDWIFCLVRTDKANKHNGISFVLFDMRTAGVSTKPIMLISGNSPFCETFFDNVRVEKNNLIGTLNAGWNVAKYLLTQERDMIGAMGEESAPPSVSQTAKAKVGLDPQNRLEDAQLRAQIAEFDLDEAAFRLTLERVGDMQRLEKAHAAMSSMLKYYGAELNKRRWELLMTCGGIDELEWESKKSQQGFVARSWLRSKGNSIEGGTSEVQLNVIAKRILELPGA